MDDQKGLRDEQLKDVTGGARTAPLDGKSLIRSLYDAGSSIEKKEEEGIVKLEKAVSDLFRKK